MVSKGSRASPSANLKDDEVIFFFQAGSTTITVDTDEDGEDWLVEKL